MKRMFLFLGLGIFSLGTLLAQAPQATQTTTQTTTIVEDKNAPELTLDKTVYDFGTIAYKSNGAFEFSFKNTGKEPLIISNVQKTCGCTSLDWTKDPVKSGDKGVIKVTYDTSRTGAFTKNIIVFSNSKTPQVTLTFKGTVENPPAAAEPETTK